MTVSMAIDASKELGQHNDRQPRFALAYVFATVVHYDRHCAPRQTLSPSV